MPMRQIALAVLCAGALGGSACVTSGAMPALPDGHPANAEAPSVPAPATSGLLDRSAPPPGPPATASPHAGVQSAGPEPATEAAAHAEHGEPGGESGGGTASAAYVCPMHPEVRSATPGSCPICGMALEPTAPPPPPATVEDPHAGHTPPEDGR